MIILASSRAPLTKSNRVWLFQRFPLLAQAGQHRVGEGEVGLCPLLPVPALLLGKRSCQSLRAAGHWQSPLLPHTIKEVITGPVTEAITGWIQGWEVPGRAQAVGCGSPLPPAMGILGSAGVSAAVPTKRRLLQAVLSGHHTLYLISPI